MEVEHRLPAVTTVMAALVPSPASRDEAGASFDPHTTWSDAATLPVRRRRHALRRALVDLAAPDADAAQVEACSLRAAKAALTLAEADDAEGLAAILRPDPASREIVWTVACYEIGHLIPTSVRDLSDPVEAILLVAGCPEASHIASELVASTGAGLRWNVFIRAGETVRIQLPSVSNAAGGADHDMAAGAQRRWDDQLASWSVEAEPAPPPDLGSGSESPWAARAVEAAVAAALQAAATVHAAELEAATIRHTAEMEAVEARHIASIEQARLYSAAVESRLATFLESIDARMGQIEAAVRALRAEPALPASIPTLARRIAALPETRPSVAGLRDRIQRRTISSPNERSAAAEHRSDTECKPSRH